MKKTQRGKSFRDIVLQIVGDIPRGSTMTYKQVASMAGSPGAARAVGSIMRKNADMNIPCHRVVRSDGKPGGYNGLRGESKEKILATEIYLISTITS